ncbi:hypothetical protein EX30DRAFT_392601 [Ascodesmis nigricans]|uniref:G domain-containing protein n=1 Tax=Ascodesmis nigricans TaxID=341454 RepID=A0A4S2N7J8_9PEZI|nr:hypothetical protein EX30DRAFT_392601 [Ascodesmis nigricans]
MVAASALLRRTLRSSLSRASPRLTQSTAASRLLQVSARRSLSSTAPRPLPPHAISEFSKHQLAVAASKWKPPAFCPGCGAPSQDLDRNLPGYYPEKPRRRLLEQMLRKEQQPRQRTVEEDLWDDAVARLRDDPRVLQQLGVQKDDEGYVVRRSYHKKKEDEKNALQIPHCNRCHDLLHTHTAPPPPAYPTLDTLVNLLLNSPHKVNHIYHLVDASDFPLTLERNLRNHLHSKLPNRITRHLTVSYVITRCDVLMKKREQVTSLMSYFKSVISEYIPARERVETPDAPLHAISTRCGWDIGKLKSEIVNRQGGVWFVGAVNVGKSSLLRDVWPQGGIVRDMSIADAAEFEILPDPELWQKDAYKDVLDTPELAELENDQDGKEIGEKVNWILDKAGRGDMPSTAAPQYPPAVSAIPGTTVAPIRVGYTTKGRPGKFRGEIVDLPGLTRWVGFGETGLMKYVERDFRLEILMKKVPLLQQRSLKPGQSFLLGGLVMITPKTPDVTFLVNVFTRLPAHFAATRKCINFLNHPNPRKAFDSEILYQNPDEIGIVTPYRRFMGAEDVHAVQGLDGKTDIEMPRAYQSAGIFTLDEDVTMHRNPMLDDRSPEGIDALPYKVFGTDIVLEGIGWVEIHAQVKKDRMTGQYPKLQVEVWSLEGEGVAQRKAINAYPRLMEGAKNVGKYKKLKVRRGSKKGEKKQIRLLNRTKGVIKARRVKTGPKLY